MDTYTRLTLIIFAIGILIGTIAFARAQLADLRRIEKQADKDQEFMDWIRDTYLPAYYRAHNIDPEQAQRDAADLMDNMRR